MNLHKAKGLEAKVVFLADPTGGIRQRVDVHIERTELKAHGWLKMIRRTEGSYKETLLGAPADWPAYEAAELPYLEAEEDRLLYVAATRAREMLVVSCSTGNRRTPAAWGALNSFLTHAHELIVPAQISVSAVKPLECSEAAQAVAAHGRAELLAVVNQPSWTITSVTAEARHIARMTRSVDAPIDDPTKVVTTDTPSHRADAGQAWGTLIHGLLEHAMRHKEATADDLHRLGMWLTVEEPALRDVLDLAVNTILQVSKAEFWDEAKQSDHSVETPFAFAQEPNVILTGVIDLMFRREDRWRIIDYKTGVGSAELAARYQEQLKMYERALGSVGIQGITSAIQPVRDVNE
jgi:ATP-dependent helicase/nuclease subunit A